LASNLPKASVSSSMESVPSGALNSEVTSAADSSRGLFHSESLSPTEGPRTFTRPRSDALSREESRSPPRRPSLALRAKSSADTRRALELAATGGSRRARAQLNAIQIGDGGPRCVASGDACPWWRLDGAIKKRPTSESPPSIGDGECPICLECSEDPVSLHCRHVFCRQCICKHVTISAWRGVVRCPCCMGSLNVIDYRALHTGDPGVNRLANPDETRQPDTLERLMRRAASERPGEETVASTSGSNRRIIARPRGPPPAHGMPSQRWVHERRHHPPTEQDEIELRQATRGLELRHCPRCQVPIQKNGGCDNVRCPCGHSFSWPRARPVHACRRPHTNMFWGKSCPHCSRVARTRLAVRRAGLVALATPMAVGAAGVVTAAAGAALVVAALPAVTFGPLALAYTPVAKLRKKRNPFLVPAASGVAALCIACMQYDSD